MFFPRRSACANVVWAVWASYFPPVSDFRASSPIFLFSYLRVPIVLGVPRESSARRSFPTSEAQRSRSQACPAYPRTLARPARLNLRSGGQLAIGAFTLIARDSASVRLLGCDLAVFGTTIGGIDNPRSTVSPGPL